ncbi:hypothetical protein D6745_02165 [Candidatus Woesearchaeota archaeon]|nr:MAG: hypothetical protein D6745_02165 [Candidatus Woesearchaeota archaeon]
MAVKSCFPEDAAIGHYPKVRREPKWRLMRARDYRFTLIMRNDIELVRPRYEEFEQARRHVVAIAYGTLIEALLKNEEKKAKVIVDGEMPGIESLIINHLSKLNGNRPSVVFQADADRTYPIVNYADNIAWWIYQKQRRGESLQRWKEKKVRFELEDLL